MAVTRIAQISDMHITDAHPPYGVDTVTKLRQTLDAIAALNVTAIIATGDLVQDGTAQEYAVLRSALQHAPAPVYLLSGNHDQNAALREAFFDHAYLPTHGDLSYAVVVGNARIVMFDATWPGKIGGRMTIERAQWLEETLAQSPDQCTLLALHHPPFRTFDPGFDAMGLDSADMLAAVLRRHRQVRRVLCGHFHRATIGEIAERPAIVCPSSGWHYRLALANGQPHTPPTCEQSGFLLHLSDDDGAITTTALWI